MNFYLGEGEVSWWDWAKVFGFENGKNGILYVVNGLGAFSVKVGETDVTLNKSLIPPKGLQEFQRQDRSR